MRHARAFSAAVIIPALVLAFAAPTSAMASGADETEDLAALSTAVNPDAAEVAAFDVDGETLATETGAGTAVAVAGADGDTSIAFAMPGAAEPYLDIAVDQSGTAEPVEASDAGLAVAATTDATEPSVVVSATEQGTSIQAILESPAAGSSVRFDVGDDQLRLLDDGAVEIIETDVQAPGMEVVLARIEAPWAFDATGAAVDTAFSIEGSTLVQHVDPTTGTVYPIVADPYQHNGPSYPQIRWTWQETRALNANKGNYAAAVAICGTIGALAWVAGVVGLAVCASQFIRWANAIGNAHAAGRCFAANFGIPGPTPSSYACRR
ncbi:MULTISPECIES: hypothetical protein [unclassified Agrococcus]|uniref:hypothetical protein n=1 Tax=unclassified Agrococcus TaxID=2615065 RepID=UPI00360EE182